MGPSAAVLAGALALLLAGGATGHGDPPAPSPAPAAAGLPADALGAIAADLAAEQARLGIPGLGLAISRGGRVVHVWASGLADVENDVPARSETVYRWASVSKPVTAVAVMQLVEQKKLDLDVPVQAYVPGFPRKRWPITARQLLSHTSGIRTYGPGEWQSTKRYERLAEALVLFKDDPLAAAPGSRFLYTTLGYTLLGVALEGASGLGFVEYLERNVFAPADMVTAGPDDERAIVRHRARGYRFDEGRVLRNSGLADTSYKIPGGGLAGSVEDLGRFAAALQAGKLLRPETVELMFTPHRLDSGAPLEYALGWRVGHGDGIREAWHTGGQQRVSTVLFTQPERKVAVAILANLEDVSAALVPLARRIAAAVPAP